ncbi:hypothetical protein BDF19DRAFT_189124 [Syncephalis fuscata]|nr:hypothetical protein BDF19DRAFT_189124 [Syncephalis fuscata]
MMVHRLRGWVTSELMSRMPAYSRGSLLVQWSEIVRVRIQQLANYSLDPLAAYLSAIMASWTLLSEPNQQQVQLAVWRLGPHVYGERARLLFSLAIQTPLTFDDIIYQELPKEYITAPISLDTTSRKYAEQQLNWVNYMSLALSDRCRVQLDKISVAGLKRKASTLMPPPLPFISTDIDTDKRGEFMVGASILEAQLGQLGISDAERTAQEKRERLTERVLFQQSAFIDGQERGLRHRVRLLPGQEIIHQQLTALCQHPSALIATRAIELLGAYERDEPMLLWRSPHSAIGNAKPADRPTGLHRIRCHASLVGHMTPTSVNSTINFLAGMVKYGLREKPELLDSILVEVYPALTALVPYTGKMSIRELRKNKLEAMVTHAADFWLGNSHQDGHDAIHEINRGKPLTSQLKSQLTRTAYIRIAQAQWLTSIIQHAPDECLDLSKIIVSFIPDLPRITGATAKSLDAQYLHDLVYLRASAWLTFLVAMIDLVDEHRVSAEHVVSMAGGLDCILRYCYEDAIVLPQVLMAYERLSRRFRALLAQTSGDHIILPALFEVYALLHPKPAAGQIELAWKTLRDIAPDEFLFSALCAVAPIIVEDDDSKKQEHEDDYHEHAKRYVKTPEERAWLFFQLLLKLDIRGSNNYIGLSATNTVSLAMNTNTITPATMKRNRGFTNGDANTSNSANLFGSMSGIAITKTTSTGVTSNSTGTATTINATTATGKAMNSTNMESMIMNHASLAMAASIPMDYRSCWLMLTIVDM